MSIAWAPVWSSAWTCGGLDCTTQTTNPTGMCDEHDAA
jgi:hypothetical protein